jgi:antitoxin PrlF
MRTTACFRGVVRSAIVKGDVELMAGPQATTGLGGGALSYPQHDVSAEGAPISLPSSKAHGTQAMSTAVATSKGQITIPVDVREALQLKAGDRVEFVQIEPGRFEVVAATRPVSDLKGLFGRPSKAVSIDALNKAIAVRRASARLSAWTPMCWFASSCKTTPSNLPTPTS